MGESSYLGIKFGLHVLLLLYPSYSRAYILCCIEHFLHILLSSVHFVPHTSPEGDGLNPSPRTLSENFMAFHILLQKCL